MLEIIKTYPCDARNYSKRTGKVKYIVIHYVGAAGNAKQNAIYYGREYVGASAHFFVGHASEGVPVYQSVDPAHRAWHCGTEGAYKHPYCRNDNSIGIEICCHYDAQRGWYFDPESVDAAIELTKQLMQEYSVPAENVLRHYDVTGKNCPAPFVKDAAAWADFKNKIVEVEEEEMKQIYNWVPECPEWARPYVQKAWELGWIKGDLNGCLQLDDDKIWTLVVLLRAQGIME